MKDQAAVIAMAWKEHSHTFPRAITIQEQSYNTIARAMRDGNLIVLTGRAEVPPDDTEFKIVTETYASPPFHGPSGRTDTANPLKFQRQKVDAIVKALEGA